MSVTGVHRCRRPLLASAAALAFSAVACGTVTAERAEATNAVVSVSSGDALVLALRSAKPGSEIRVAPGRYPLVRIRAVRFGSPVTIRPSGPVGSAVFAAIDIADSRGLVLKDLAFAGEPAPARYAVNIHGSSDIALVGLRLDGSAIKADRHVASAVMVRDSRSVAVLGSLFSNHWHGLTLLNVTGLVVEGNGFRHMETDGVRGGGVSNAVIARNSFTDFHPRPGDHADGIQLWTTNVTSRAHDVEIRGNLVARGAGGATQGVFVRDEKLQLPYERLTIADNLIIGEHYNSITVSGAIAPVVTGNRVIAYPDQDAWIRMQAVSNATLTSNTAFRYTLQSATFAAKHDNTTKPARRVIISREIADWLAKTGRTAKDADPVLRDLLTRR